MRGALALLALLALIGPVAAQPEPEPAAAPVPDLDDLLDAARSDPEGTLRRIDALLAGSSLDAGGREAVQRARARALAGAGRRDEAARTLRALLARGADVAGDLLALVGARLEVETASATPGAPAHLTLRGAATGPLTLRLYAVDSARWRAAWAADPDRGLLGHLRAPPSTALSRTAAWQVPALPPEGGRVEVETPQPLPGGVHLLTVEARGVLLPIPLVVSRAVAAVRRGVGEGLVFLVDRTTGAPLPGVTFTALGPRGRPREALGTTGPAGSPQAGLLRYGGDPAGAFGWLDGRELILIDLLPEAAPPAPLRPPLEGDLPRHAAGQPIRLWAHGLEEATPLRLLDPDGLCWAERELKPDRSGVAATSLTPSPHAPPGEWQVAVGSRRYPLTLDPPQGPLARLTTALEWIAPHAEGAPQVAARVEGRLATDVPLAGREVAWRLTATRASPPFHEQAADVTGATAGVRPLPRYAPRTWGAPRVLAAGAVSLDASGRAEWRVELAREGPIELLRLEASLIDGPLRAAAWSDLDRDPADESVAVLIEPHIAAPREVVRAEVVAFRGDGAPLPRRDVVLEGCPDRESERRALRTDERGRASSVLAGASGTREWEVQFEGSPHPAGIAMLWRAYPGSFVAPGPLDAGVYLCPSPVGLRGMVALPSLSTRSRAWALLTREQASLVDAQVLPVDSFTRRWDPTPLPVPGGAYRVTTWGRDRAWFAADSLLPTAPEPLRVTVARPEGPLAPGAAVRLTVQTSETQGGPRPARLYGSLYPDEVARSLDRRRRDPPTPPVAVRGTGDRAAPSGRGGDGATTTAPVPDWPEGAQAAGELQGGWSNGLGRATVNVQTPTEPGRYWVRLEAVDSEGRRGAAWCPVVVETPLTAKLIAPRHLRVGDRSEAVLVVRAHAPEAELAEGALALSWKAAGVTVGTPRIEGTRPFLEGDPGRDALRLRAAPRLRIVFPLQATAPGDVRLEATVALESHPDHEQQQVAAWPILPQALEVTTARAVSAPAGEEVRLELDLPRDALPGRSTLVVAADVWPATVALAALRDLEAVPGLRARVLALAARGPLAEALLARRLAPPDPPVPASAAEVEEVVSLLIAARQPNGGWGSATADVVAALWRLREQGHVVPRALVEQAAAASSPAPDLAEAAVAALDLRARAALLRRLAEAGQRADLQEWLWTDLLAARVGPGWSDPGLTAAALGAATALIAAGGERPAATVEVRHEGKPLLEGWTGDGLARWLGPARLTGAKVATRSRLRAQAGAPLHLALRTTSWVPHPEAQARGLRVERRLEEPAAACGDRVRLVLSVAAEGPAPDAPLRVELPLPGGCTVLAAPPGATLRDGVLVWESDPGEVTIELLALLPGAYALAPARATALGGERWGVSAPAALAITER